jgi:hypothetical protein
MGSGSLAPWVANEVWEFGSYPNGKRWARVSGRERCPEHLKRDPKWWAQNSFEEQVQDWYMPNRPKWQRELMWNYFRNPFQNARLFVWGVADRNYMVDVIEGNPDPMVVQRDDVGELGYQRTRLTLDDGTVKTFTSYCSKHLVYYYGHQPSGIYGTKLTIR